MIWNKIYKNLEVLSKDRKTREKDLIKTFYKKNADFNYANKWHVPLLKSKVKIKSMIIINFILFCIMALLIIK
tara:strand:- start:265 stop:483 length:219 start_codon:yes stop_codon:yes gene_type:complete